MGGIRVNLSLEFPDLDRRALAEHLGPVITEVLAAGGNFTSVFLTPVDEDED